MRFTIFTTLMAAGTAIASYQPPAEYPAPADEETTTLTQTTTRYITVTHCAEGNPDCPANQPSTSAAPVEPTPEPTPEPVYEPVPEPETSSEVVYVVPSSSALPVPASSSAYYPLPVQNTTSHAGPTAGVPHTTLSYAVPVVTSTEVVVPSSAPSEVPSQVPASGAGALSLQGGLLAGMFAMGVAALF